MVVVVASLADYKSDGGGLTVNSGVLCLRYIIVELINRLSCGLYSKCLVKL